MRIIFWGTPTIAVPSLQEIADDCIAVVTQQDKPKGRNRNRLIASPVKEFALQHNIPILQPESPNDEEFLATIRKLSPDIMVLAAYGKILSKALLQIPPLGFINIHFSLLPKYRGASPVAAAILNGDTETGVTIMQLVQKMDAGPIYESAKLQMDHQETRGKLENRLAQLSAPLLSSTLKKIMMGTLLAQKQVEKQASYCPLIKKQDGAIDWRQDALSIERFIRAMSFWPTAYSTLCRQNQKSQRVIIHKASVVPCVASSEISPGSILSIDPTGIQVMTGKDSLKVECLQKSGKQAMQVATFLRGNPIEVGDYFETRKDK